MMMFLHPFFYLSFFVHRCYNPCDWVILDVPIDLLDTIIPGMFLPLIIMDHIHSDKDDMLSYISTFHLCKSFDSQGLLNENKLHPNEVYLHGDLVLVDAPVSLLVEHIPHLTKSQLTKLGKPHSAEFVSCV